MNGGEGFSLSRSLENAFDRIIGFLPELLGAILLLIIGWIVARILKKLTTSLLRKLRFERSITLSPAGNYITRIIEHPTAFVGKIVYWLVFLLFVSFALSALGVPALNEIISAIYSYIPNIIAAILIFLVASAITAGAEAFVVKVMAPGALSRLLSVIVPAIIMPIAAFMILNQLKIAPEIVNITYAALVGSVALGLALAFGLGGRDVAARILEQAYSKAQYEGDQMKQELQQTRSNVRSKGRSAKRNMES